MSKLADFPKREAAATGDHNAIDHQLTAGPITPGLGRCVFTGATLRMIIRSAFGIDLVEGGPKLDWRGRIRDE